MMNDAILFYFDFLSPYAYFARHRLVQIAALHGRTIDYRPIDLRRAKLESGNNGPSTTTIPNKLKFATRDFMRWSARYGIPFAFVAGPAGGQDFNIGTIYARQRGQEALFVERVYHHGWGRGGSYDDPGFRAELAHGLEWDLADFETYVTSAAAAQAYEAVFAEAKADHVFGVPAIVIGEELWWGNDRLFMVDEYLAAQPR